MISFAVNPKKTRRKQTRKAQTKQSESFQFPLTTPSSLQETNREEGIQPLACSHGQLHLCSHRMKRAMSTELLDDQTDPCACSVSLNQFTAASLAASVGGGDEGSSGGGVVRNER